MLMTKTQPLRKKIDANLKTWQWWLATGLCFEVFRRAMGWTEGLYIQTLFPASVFEGQTSFSGEQVKTFYAFMIERGTLEKYINVQIVDFCFMITMFFAMAALTIAAYRALPEQRHMKNFAWLLVLIIPLAPLFDAMENGVSFSMLADPVNFPNWLAIIQSTFASIKFLLTGIGFFWSILAIFIGLFCYMISFFRPVKIHSEN